MRATLLCHVLEHNFSEASDVERRLHRNNNFLFKLLLEYLHCLNKFLLLSLLCLSRFWFSTSATKCWPNLGCSSRLWRSFEGSLGIDSISGSISDNDGSGLLVCSDRSFFKSGISSISSDVQLWRQNTFWKKSLKLQPISTEVKVLEDQKLFICRIRYGWH